MNSLLPPGRGRAASREQGLQGAPPLRVGRRAAALEEAAQEVCRVPLASGPEHGVGEPPPRGLPESRLGAVGPRGGVGDLLVDQGAELPPQLVLVVGRSRDGQGECRGLLGYAVARSNLPRGVCDLSVLAGLT